MEIGVDIGGSKILVVEGNRQYEIVHQAKVETPEDGAQGIMEVIHLIEQVAGKDEVKAIAVAAAALDRKAGTILPTSPNMHGWRGTDIVTPLKNHFKASVEGAVDVVAAGVAEAELGAGRDYDNVLYVTISTGIGASLVVKGRPYHGEYDLEAGHIILDPDGPVCGCGGRGHFEAMCSGKAIKKKYGKYGYEITDPATWDEIAATMALGFHSLISSYSPSVVVIGGGVGVHYAKFHDFLIKHLEALTPMYPLPPIVQAKYVETAVAYGTLILASRLAP
jgi:predicted NBD/HSP70 family sugar kinase